MILSFFSGLIFGIGLIVSGMTNPAKVIGFLDIAGAWDPSLGFVMLGAISVAFFSFRLAKKRKHTYTGIPILLPETKAIDLKLILGSTTFGVGWGLAGYCPGPALATIFTWQVAPLLFVSAMVLGMALYELIEYVKAKYQT